jgi:hypothetical protein
MTKKQLLLLAIAVVLLCGYAYYFTDWFASESIQIVHTLRPYTPPRRGPRRGSDDNPAANTVSFGFNRKYRLTEIKVIPVSDLATNKYAHPIWHLVSESNSVPTKAFVYGMNIQGMHPKVPGARPDPLQPGVPYRLFVDTGELKGEHEFTTTPRTGSPK